jgi:hypothetical protein
VLYVCKGGWGARDEAVPTWKIPHDVGGWSQFKEFTVHRDDDLTEELWQRAVARERHRRGGPLPGRICATQHDRRATNCRVAWYCFREDG